MEKNSHADAQWRLETGETTMPNICNAVPCNRNAVQSFTTYTSDDTSPLERKNSIELCAHHIADTKRIAVWGQHTPPGFVTFVQWPNGSWQKVRYVESSERTG